MPEVKNAMDAAVMTFIKAVVSKFANYKLTLYIFPLVK